MSLILLFATTAVFATETSEDCFDTPALINIRWMNQEEVRTFETEHAAAELRPTNPEVMTASGYVYARVQGPTIEHASLERYTIVVQGASGAELARIRSEYVSPDLPSENARNYWANSMGDFVHKTVDYPVTVYVIDTFAAKRCEFSVDSASRPTLRKAGERVEVGASPYQQAVRDGVIATLPGSATPVPVSTATTSGLVPPHTPVTEPRAMLSGTTDRGPQTIMCNDGTRSPSCTSCSRGCCSSHGGCR